MLGATHERALATVCARLEAASRSSPPQRALRWACSGSVALALHGFEVGCRDLDLLTTVDDAPRLCATIAGAIIEPVGFRVRDALRGNIGRTRLEGIEVEILGGVENLLPDGTWSAPPPLEGEIEAIPVAGHACPVLAIPALRAAYVAMRRTEKVALIDAATASGSGTSSSPRRPPRGRS